jgi:hypothetical protein
MTERSADLVAYYIQVQSSSSDAACKSARPPDASTPCELTTSQVEVVPHPRTSQQVVENVMKFFSSVGKRPVLLKHEVPA